jgi:hypothetical protein
VEATDVTERHATSNDEFDDIDDDEPTEEECKSLRRIADQLPWAVWYSSPCHAITSRSISIHAYK